MSRSRWVLLARICALSFVVACATGPESPDVGVAGSSGHAGSNGSGSNGDSGDSGIDVPVAERDECHSGDPDKDFDEDGYTPNQGDCNDCIATINPGAFDEPGDGIDNDCDGTIDNEIVQCDEDLAISNSDARNGARAMDLCRFSSPTAQGADKTWGVLSAKYVLADGTAGMYSLSRGLLPKFGGVQPQGGKSMLALSTGTARDPSQAGYLSPDGVKTGTESKAPEGFPKPSEFCPGVVSGAVKDPAALELEIRVPTNALSFWFDFVFFTQEFPNFICSRYNDTYVTLLWPTPPNQSDNNISFDLDKNVISVNNALLQVCEKQTAGGRDFDCPKGTDMLDGTGFDVNSPGYAPGPGDPVNYPPHAATGWLRTTTSVEPGSVIKLRFAIWDSEDEVWDSTVLIDNFTWQTFEAPTITVPIK